ncbi:hypothetical protein [Daejeonella sp.]|uniref:hypothetical protein n=1 Tax=Daejeonella sp. TaxID=2805397 RepID=UPI003983A368
MGHILSLQLESRQRAAAAPDAMEVSAGALLVHSASVLPTGRQAMRNDGERGFSGLAVEAYLTPSDCSGAGLRPACIRTKRKAATLVRRALPFFQRELSASSAD